MDYMKPVAYTYLIGWTKQNKWYYGVRYAKGCSPSDLWEKYFTSSKFVKFFRRKHGEPDVRQVRRVFKNKENAIKWEKKVLTRLCVLNNNKWINANIASAPNNPGGKKLSIEQKMNMSKAQKARPPESRKLPKKVKDKISKALKGRTFTKEHKAALSRAKKNHVPWNKGLKGKSGGNPQTKVHTCPHCGKVGKGNAMFKYHFDRCKYKR